MPDPVCRFEIECTTHVTEEIRLEIKTAIAQWFIDPKHEQKNVGKPAVIETDNIKVFLKYDDRTNICSIRYRRRWSSGKVSRRCSMLKNPPKLSIGFAEGILTKIAGFHRNATELWTKAAHAKLLRMIDLFRNDPSAYQVQRIGGGRYRLRDVQGNRVLAIVQITDQDSVLIEDLSFLPSIAESKFTC